MVCFKESNTNAVTTKHKYNVTEKGYERQRPTKRKTQNTSIQPTANSRCFFFMSAFVARRLMHLVRHINKYENQNNNIGVITMGIGRFLKTIVSPKAMAEEIISLQERAYKEAAKMYKDANPHVLLAQVWLSRIAAAKMGDPNDTATQQKAFYETWQFAIIPWPYNIKALGLYFVTKEHPEIITMYPAYQIEFDELLLPGLQAMHDGSFFELYEERNPNMAYEKSRESPSGWIFYPKNQ